MASSTSSVPNHYDALGLSPTASENEIAQAFRKAMGLFGAHSAAAAAQLAYAFETLRNPEKRRAYDDSIGLNRRQPPMALSFRISTQPPVAEPHVESAPAPPQPSSIASSLQEIARPVDLTPSLRPAVQPHPIPSKPPITQLSEQDARDADDRPIDWQKPVVAIGAIVLAAGLVGAFAGVSVKGDEQGQAAVTAALPPPKPHANVAETTAAAPAIVEPAAARAERSHRAQFGRTWPQRSAPQPSAAAEQPTDSAAAQVPAQGEAADPLAPQPDSSIETVAAAGLPMATSLVARTIDRIGYACGHVASTSPVEGAAGVYKVTCTSGQTYRAAPVHGRYRFRRWGSH